MDEHRFLEELDTRQRAAWPARISSQPVFPLGETALTAYLRAWARTHPHRIAIDYYGTTLDFLELDRLSDRCAAVFADHGVNPGDRVAVLLANCPQASIAFFGILKLGAVYVPIHPATATEDLFDRFEEAGIEAAVVLDDLAPTLLAVQAATRLSTIFTTNIAEMVSADPAQPLPAGFRTVPERHNGTIDFLATLRESSGSRQWPDADLDSLAAIHYTAGTTGSPKGCMHSQRGLVNAAAASVATTLVITDIGPTSPSDDVLLHFRPGQQFTDQLRSLVLPVFTGARLVLMADWEPAIAMATIERCRVTSAAMLVDNLVEILAHPDRDRHQLDSLRRTQVAPGLRGLAPDLRRHWHRLTGSEVQEMGWGMAETLATVTFTTGMQDQDRDLNGEPAFVGLPVPGARIMICDLVNGDILPLGHKGEIVVSAPSLFKGYWGRPEGTVNRVVNGWFRTGDIGAYDELGQLRYLGRHQEMLTVKGIEVFPLEIESILGAHPAVAACAVIGLPDAHGSDQPLAFVSLRPGHEAGITAASLREWCRGQLAGYALPEVRLVDSLPLTADGLPRRRALLDRLH